MPENHQNLAVVIDEPDGRRVKKSAEVVGGPMRDEDKLRHLILAQHPEGSKLVSIIRLDQRGNPVPDHPITGPFVPSEERATTPETADLTKSVPPLPSPIPANAKPAVTPPVTPHKAADGGLVAQ